MTNTSITTAARSWRRGERSNTRDHTHTHTVFLLKCIIPAVMVGLGPVKLSPRNDKIHWVQLW